MLGSIKSGWHWAAYGKHPSAKDYFRLGPESPLAKSFSDWVERGYSELVSKKDSGRGPVAWRFWARGAGRETLVCGLVKDSSDSLGRPYPFLIIGSGCLNNWEDQWDLLPIACEKPWGRIEYLSARMFDDFRTLETEIHNIRPPFPEWPEFNKKREHLISEKTCFAAPGGPEERAAGLAEGDRGVICLDRESFHDQFALISLWHRLLKKSDKTVPNAIFMGGTVERSYLAFFKRPLLTGDFVRLWSISSGSEKCITEKFDLCN